jgi:hypothetical protein
MASDISCTSSPEKVPKSNAETFFSTVSSAPTRVCAGLVFAVVRVFGAAALPGLYGISVTG